MSGVGPHDSPEALSEAFAVAINAGDVAAALDLWIEDAGIVQPDGRMLRGRDLIGDALRAIVENAVRVELEVAAVFTTSEAAVAVGSLRMSGAGEDGAAFITESQSVVVYSKGADGRWRLAIDAPWGLPRS